jgi:AraC-like DNA-binding protein
MRPVSDDLRDRPPIERLSPRAAPTLPKVSTIVGHAMQPGGPDTRRVPSANKFLGACTLNRAAFPYYARLARVKQHIDQSADRFVPLAEAARIACLTPKYFSSFFRARVGLTFVHWQWLVRTDRAATLLAATDESIIRVAHRVGFGSVRTFERVFKACVGCSPRDYKMAVRPYIGADVAPRSGELSHTSEYVSRQYGRPSRQPVIKP